ncbi:MAG TPA: heme exporter protein CcmB [Bryobacteraceae bacterium]|jgi:heme exporter protein B
MKTLRQALVITRKDLRAELRTKETLNAAVSFSISVLLLFSFALDPTPDQTAEIGGGVLWMIFLFAGTLVFNRSFARELPNDCLDALVASPASSAAIFLGKCFAGFSMMLIVEVLSLPVFVLFFGGRIMDHPGQLSVTLLLATWSVTIMGTTFSALTVNLRLRELMLPVLVYPMLLPAMLAAFRLLTMLVAGQAIGSEDLQWLRVLFGFDLIFTCLALALADSILVN